MAYTYRDVLKSDEYEASKYDGRRKMVEDHWDRIERMAKSENDLLNVKQFRDVSLAGLESHHKAAGLIGDGTYKEQDQQEAAAWDDLYIQMEAANLPATDPHEYVRRAKEVNELVDGNREERRAEMEKLGGSLKIEADRREQLESLATSDVQLSEQRDAARIMDPDKGRIERDKAGAWTAPSTAVSSRNRYDESDGSISSKVGDGLFRMGNELSRFFGGRDATTDRQKNIEAAKRYYKPGAAPLPKEELDSFVEFEEQKGNTLSENIRDFQELSGLDDEQVKTVWSDYQNDYRAWDKGELIRINSSGRIRANIDGDKIITDLKGIKEAIIASSATDAAKKLAISDLDSQRERAAVASVPSLSLIGFVHPTLPSFDEYLVTQLDEGVPLPDAIEEYLEANEVGDTMDTLLRLGISGGGQVYQRIFATVGLLGSQNFAEDAAFLGQKISEFEEGSLRLNDHPGFFGRGLDAIAGEAPSLAFDVLTTKGATSALGLTGKAATRATMSSSRLAAAKVLSSAGMIGSAGWESGVLTYASAYNQSRTVEGLSHEEAHSLSQDKAAIAAITTGIVTLGFNVKGFGGAESIPGNMAMRNFRQRVAQSGKSLSQIKKHLRPHAKRMMTVLKSTIGEGGEEWTDEFLNSFLTADDSDSVAGAWTNAMDAATAGAWIGFGAGLFNARADGKQDAREQVILRKLEKEAEEQLKEFDVVPEDEGQTLNLPGPKPARPAREVPVEVWTAEDGSQVGVFDSDVEGMGQTVKVWDLDTEQWVDTGVARDVHPLAMR